MTPEERAREREEHRRGGPRREGWEQPLPRLCLRCKDHWPCLPFRLLDELDAKDARIAKLLSGIEQVYIMIDEEVNVAVTLELLNEILEPFR